MTALVVEEVYTAGSRGISAGEPGFHLDTVGWDPLHNAYIGGTKRARTITVEMLGQGRFGPVQRMELKGLGQATHQHPWV